MRNQRLSRQIGRVEYSVSYSKPLGFENGLRKTSSNTKTLRLTMKIYFSFRYEGVRQFSMHAERVYAQPSKRVND